MNPVLWALMASAVATAVVLLDRHRKGRNNVLDAWAERHRLACVKDPPVQVLARLEPLAVVPPVVEVERMVTGMIQDPPLSCAVQLAVCLAGNRHRPRRYLVGVFDSHPELPALRVLPEGPGPVTADDVPQELGFVPMPGSGLPPGYRVEAFSPLPRALVEAIGMQLQAAGASGFRVELRPGRIILATPVLAVAQVNRLIELHLALQHALHALLTAPAAPPAPAGGAGGPPPPGGRWLN